MLTRKYNSTNGHISRLLVLPLSAFILFACSVKDKKDLAAEKEIATKTESNQPVTTLTDSTQTKNSNLIGQVDPDDKIYEKVEVEAEFPGGLRAWRRYLERNLNAQVPSDAGAPTGSYTVIAKFIVDQMGNVSDVKTLTKHGYGMEEEVRRALKAGPKWTPPIHNGRNVTAYRQQPITFVIAEQDQTLKEKK
jgi:outer membrane biosynthesis protein TonB